MKFPWLVQEVALDCVPTSLCWISFSFEWMNSSISRAEKEAKVSCVFQLQFPVVRCRVGNVLDYLTLCSGDNHDREAIPVTGNTALRWVSKFFTDLTLKQKRANFAFFILRKCQDKKPWERVLLKKIADFQRCVLTSLGLADLPVLRIVAIRFRS